MNISLFGDETVARAAPPAGEVLVAVLGDTTVDVSRVALPDAVRCTAVSECGDVTFIVPPGTAVEFGGLSLIGDWTFKPRQRSGVQPRPPVLSVTGIALLGDVKVVEAGS